MSCQRTPALGIRRKVGLLNPVNNEAGLEPESEERADRAMEEPLRLGLPDDALRLPRERREIG
jgi:hypothetical protein